jgi:hypothetical protein
MSEHEPDTVERHEHVDIGFSCTIKSKRGTGTRDQDEVKMSIEMEERPSQEQLENFTRHVENVMGMRRSDQPDGEGDG